ncbi:MAG: hypothetical protein Q4G67_12065, partial [Actinomycetia bacterium]|nr:hypothetical protein [Actinomycetes bacterium]
RLVGLLATAVAVGGLVELATIRHWEGLQLIPWFVLAIVAVVGVVALDAPPLLTRLVGTIAILGGALGVLQHLLGNLALGPHLPEYADAWPSASVLEQWWLAASGAVGAAPPLAPGLVAISGALLLISSIGSRSRAATA